MLMTPGLGLLYSGLTRKKNAISTLAQCFVAVAVISLVWVLWGYSLAFGPDRGGFIGGLEWVGMQSVGHEPKDGYAPTIPHLAFAAFQMMFAVITPAIIVGAFAERVRFGPFLLFIVLWSTLVYAPVAHWVWGIGGWLREMGALDFAGGTVVHINSGVAALVAALLLGRRIGYADSTFEPSNPTYVVLGAALLWFGWFGFNAGSALSSGGLASLALMNTHIAASAGSLAWMLTSYMERGKFSSISMASGAVAGLVAITPAAGFVSIPSSIAIGGIAGILCYVAVSFRSRIRIDDSLDVWGVHGIGGTWGSMATGIFASNGLLAGNPSLLFIQALGVAATWAYSAAVTFVVLKLVDASLRMRVRAEEELIGLDVTQHAEYVR